MTYQINIAYNGSKYFGLQKLKNKLTIQGELERVLTICNEKPVKVTCSGRTDKGVHALEQICTFTLDKTITPYKLKGFLNRQLKPYIYINQCLQIEDKTFHPRFSAQSKIYKYIINTGPFDTIKNDYLYNFNKPLDISKMKKIAQLFIGLHNFKAFVIGKHHSYEATIQEIDIKKENQYIIIQIRGDHFYTYMVRNLVRILILIGSDTIKEDTIKTMLETQKKIIEYSPAPPTGLYLEKIFY